MYSEDDLLPLSGLQHLVFCERQWALIHLERAWEENRLTADGRLLHARVHESAEEARNDVLIVRGLPIHSLRLGLSGQTDVVEFIRMPKTAGRDASAPASVALDGRQGWWKPQPVEYKRGRAKRDDCDRVQLCAQALCLEEMFGVRIGEGALFYGTNRRRTAVRFDSALRERTERLAARMHDLFRQRITPAALKTPACENCSLKDRCIPELPDLRRSLSKYYASCFGED